MNSELMIVLRIKHNPRVFWYAVSLLTCVINNLRPCTVIVLDSRFYALMALLPLQYFISLVWEEKLLYLLPFPVLAVQDRTTEIYITCLELLDTCFNYQQRTDEVSIFRYYVQWHCSEYSFSFEYWKLKEWVERPYSCFFMRLCFILCNFNINKDMSQQLNLSVLHVQTLVKSRDNRLIDVSSGSIS